MPVVAGDCVVHTRCLSTIESSGPAEDDSIVDSWVPPGAPPVASAVVDNRARTELLLIGGHVVTSLVSAMDDDPIVRGVLLTASDLVAEERLTAREIGGGLARAAERSREAAVELEGGVGPQVWRLSTDGRVPVELAADIIDFVGWGRSTPAPADSDDVSA